MARLLLVLAATCGRAIGDAHSALPAVSEVMNASSHTIKTISAHVSKMTARMADLSSQQQKELAEMKADYEGQLEAEKEENKRLASVNEAVSSSIWELEKGNTGLRAKASKLQDHIAKLRKTLQTVKKKVGAASVYVNSSLEATDDKGAKVLKVLELGSKVQEDSGADDTDADASADATSDSAGTDQDSDDSQQGAVNASTDATASDAADADQTSDSEQGTQDEGQAQGKSAKGESLIALHSRHRSLRSRRNERGQDADSDADNDAGASGQADESDSETDDHQEDDAADETAEAQNTTLEAKPAGGDHESQKLIKALSEELNELAKQDESSRKHMHDIFLANFNKGKEERKQILSKQKVLNGTQASLELTQHELQAAVHHLEGTSAQLETRLKGLGRYLQKLAAFALKPAPEAEQLIPSLPGTVESFLQEERRAARVKSGSSAK